MLPSSLTLIPAPPLAGASVSTPMRPSPLLVAASPTSASPSSAQRQGAPSPPSRAQRQEEESLFGGMWNSEIESLLQSRVQAESEAGPVAASAPGPAYPEDSAAARLASPASLGRGAGRASASGAMGAYRPSLFGPLAWLEEEGSSSGNPSCNPSFSGGGGGDHGAVGMGSLFDCMFTLDEDEMLRTVETDREGEKTVLLCRAVSSLGEVPPEAFGRAVKRSGSAPLPELNLFDDESGSSNLALMRVCLVRGGGEMR